MEGNCMWPTPHSRVRDNSQELKQHEQLLVSRKSHGEESKLMFGSLVKWYLREHQWGGCAERNQVINVAAGAEGGGAAGDWGCQTSYSNGWDTWQNMVACLMWPPLMHQSLQTRLTYSSKTTPSILWSAGYICSAPSLVRNWGWQWPSCSNCGVAEQGGDQTRKQRRRGVVS